MKGCGRGGFNNRHKYCLTDTPKGKTVTVTNFSSNCEIKKKLFALGIFPGQCIKMLCKRKNSPVIINTGNSNIIISESLAKEIYIK